MATHFDDGKEAGALRTIGEVGQALGIKAHVLRYWEQQFPMLKPLKRSGGRRYYRPADVALVEAINRLVNVDGYTLKGAKAALRQNPPSLDDDGAASPAATASAQTESAPHLIIGGTAQEAGDRQNDTGSDGDGGSDAMDAADLLPQLKAIRAKLATIVES